MNEKHRSILFIGWLGKELADALKFLSQKDIDDLYACYLKSEELKINIKDLRKRNKK